MGERSDDTGTKKRRGVASRCTPPLAAQPTREGVDIDDRVLARLVVDDDVNAEERHSQRLPQRPRQLPDDLVTRPLKHALDLVQLWSMGNK